MLFHFYRRRNEYMVEKMGKRKCMSFKRQLIFCHYCFSFPAQLAVPLSALPLFITSCLINILYLCIRVAFPPFDFFCVAASPARQPYI